MYIEFYSLIYISAGIITSLQELNYFLNTKLPRLATTNSNDAYDLYKITIIYSSTWAPLFARRPPATVFLNDLTRMNEIISAAVMLFISHISINVVAIEAVIKLRAASVQQLGKAGAGTRLGARTGTTVSRAVVDNRGAISRKAHSELHLS